MSCSNAGPLAPAASPFTPLRPSEVRRAAINGQPFVLVALGDTGRVARLDPYDFDRLRAAGLALPWTLEYARDGVPFVAAPAAKRSPFRIVSVARLIVGATEGEVVRYADGDRSNLTRANLSTVRVHRVSTGTKGGE